jgi:hypothetical protein
LLSFLKKKDGKAAMADIKIKECFNCGMQKIHIEKKDSGGHACYDCCVEHNNNVDLQQDLNEAYREGYKTMLEDIVSELPHLQKQILEKFENPNSNLIPLTDEEKNKIIKTAEEEYNIKSDMLMSILKRKGVKTEVKHTAILELFGLE